MLSVDFPPQSKLTEKILDWTIKLHQFEMKVILIECIFLSQGRHYDSFPDFTPSSDANWCLTDSQHWEIQVKTWVFTLKGRENLNFKTITWIKFGLNLRLNLHLNWKFYLLKKMYPFRTLSTYRKRIKTIECERKKKSCVFLACVTTPLNYLI